jgi:hypothetical protein
VRELDEHIEGIVLLKKPDELGWRLFFESLDCEDLCEFMFVCLVCRSGIDAIAAEYDREHVRAYIRLFPESALASLFRGYFAYKQEILSEDEEERDIFNLGEDVDPVDVILVHTLTFFLVLCADFNTPRTHLLGCQILFWVLGYWQKCTSTNSTMRMQSKLQNKGYAI